MSSSKKTVKMTGQVDGKPSSSNDNASVIELASDHFLVTSLTDVIEVFLTSNGLVSDGNALDGVGVSVLSEKERIISEQFANVGSASSVGGSEKEMILKAPMPGMVKSVSIAVGDKVQKNTQVLVLEAMKMENSINAGFSGVISKIHVEAGMSVEKNMSLIEFSKGD